jgi:hypothetical protein
MRKTMLAFCCIAAAAAGGMKIFIDTEVKEEAHEFGAFNTLLLVVILLVRHMRSCSFLT